MDDAVRMLGEVADRAARRGEPERVVAALRARFAGTETPPPQGSPLRDETAADLRTVAALASGSSIGMFAAAVADAGEQASRLLTAEVNAATATVDDGEQAAWAYGPLLLSLRMRLHDGCWLDRRGFVAAAFTVAEWVATSGGGYRRPRPDGPGEPMPPMPMGPRGFALVVPAGRQIRAWRACNGRFFVGDATFTLTWVSLRTLQQAPLDPATIEGWRQRWAGLAVGELEPVCVELSADHAIWPDEIAAVRVALERSLPEAFSSAGEPQLTFDGDRPVLTYGLPYPHARKVYRRGAVELTLPAGSPPLNGPIVARPV